MCSAHSFEDVCAVIPAVFGAVGAWAQAVMHPSSGLTKEYIVTLALPPSRKQLEIVAGGCVVDGTFVQPVAISQVGKPKPTIPSFISP